MTDLDLFNALGLMSGTSLDGVDAALIETDGGDRIETGPSMTTPYPDDLRDAIRECLGEKGPIEATERRLTEFHAGVVTGLLAMAGREAHEIDLIGFHGHTIFHDPAHGRTRQIGDGALLARLTGIDVVDSFRKADVAAGGQGAPLAPLYHAALAARLIKPLAVLNLGGVGNVTWIGEKGRLLAFDTGPGNALIDDFVRLRTGEPCDRGGVLAQAGAVDDAVIAILMDDPYFLLPPPKSLDRDAWPAVADLVADLSDADGAATLTMFTAASVARAAEHFPAPVRRWLVAGGGRHNPALMAMIASCLAAPAEPVEAVGWAGDALEAQAFAYLAARAVRNMPLTLPETTGVSHPLTGGRLCRSSL